LPEARDEGPRLLALKQQPDSKLEHYLNLAQYCAQGSLKPALFAQAAACTEQACHFNLNSLTDC
jgi:hypothetical protein